MKKSIDLTKYKEVDREAEIGEKIKVVDSHSTSGDYGDGDIFTVERRLYDFGIIAEELLDDYEYIAHREYVVLEPIEDSPDLADLVIRLSQTVARQQSEIDTLKADLQSFAETATEADYKAGQALVSSAAVGELSDKVDMIMDDVVMLDERSQPLVDDSKDDLVAELADTVIRKIREAIE